MRADGIERAAADAPRRPDSGHTDAGVSPGRASGWAPLRVGDFRRLWSAQFVSNVGSWMQTVAAQWVMLSLTSSAVLIGAISAAGSLPVLLFAIPAGVLGDLVDRRRLIVATQVLMLIAAAVLAILAALSVLTPALLLGLLFLIGCGTAFSAPTWQTLQPELAPGTGPRRSRLGRLIRTSLERWGRQSAGRSSRQRAPRSCSAPTLFLSLRS